jgi:CheY-like chemotaxis protein
VAHTLLLADDSVTIQRVIELTFADEDIEVIAVSDGDQAIARLESAPPDIVLADIGMPGRDGYEVARYIRQTPKLAHIPVVLLTGAFEPVDQAKATEVGCDGVLAKPFEPQLVIGRVKELLAARPRRATQPLEENRATPPAPAADQWAPPVEDKPFAPAEPPAPAVENLDEYFDKLDTAFASLSGNPPSAPAPEAIAAEPPAPAPSADDPIDWLSQRQAPPAAEPYLPLSYASPAAAFAEPPSPTPAPMYAEPVQAPSPAFVQRPRELPSVLDAFAAILEAEQSDAGPASRPAWPAASNNGYTPPGVSDEVIEQIVERVLARLSAGTIVTEVAERLVREEIARIKSSIK